MFSAERAVVVPRRNREANRWSKRFSFVVCSKQRAAAAIHAEQAAAFTGEQERFRHEQADALRPPGAWKRNTFECGVISYIVRDFAVRHHPYVLTRVQIYGSDAAPRGLDERKPLRAAPLRQAQPSCPDVVHVGQIRRMLQTNWRWIRRGRDIEIARLRVEGRALPVCTALRTG